MADTNIAGFFGITPELYQQQQQQLINAEAQNFASLDPYQQVTAGSYGAGRQLGRGIVGALGGEDPQLKIISLRNQIGKSINPNDLNSVQQAAETLARAGDQQGALQLADYLRKAQGDYALIQQRIAEKMTPEQRNAEAKAGLMDVISQLENMPASPERDRALTMRKNQLTSLTAGKPEKVADAIQVSRELGILTEALTKTQEGTPEYNNIKAQINRLEKTEKGGNVKEVGVAMGSREPVYLDVNNDQQYIYQKGADGKQMRVPYFGGVDRTTATTKVQVDAGENEFRKRLGGKDADRVDSAMSMRDNSIAALNSLNRLNELDQNALISGTFATGRVGATNFLNTLGLINQKDADNLAKSENYQKTAGDVILATLGGKLGAGFSNEDRRFIQSLVPQLENSPQARKQLIKFMVDKNQSIVQETSRLENYARDNNSLKGYMPKIPIVSVQPTSSSALQNMSIEQLQQMLKNAK